MPEKPSLVRMINLHSTANQVVYSPGEYSDVCYGVRWQITEKIKTLIINQLIPTRPIQ
jgi:hypothetical protein